MTVTEEMIMAVVTAIITYIFGKLAKKFNWIDSKYIPVQNAVVGLLAGIICYVLKISDTNLLISTIYCIFGSMTAGGTYDLAKSSKEEE